MCSCVFNLVSSVLFSFPKKHLFQFFSFRFFCAPEGYSGRGVRVLAGRVRSRVLRDAEAGAERVAPRGDPGGVFPIRGDPHGPQAVVSFGFLFLSFFVVLCVCGLGLFVFCWVRVFCCCFDICQIIILLFLLYASKCVIICMFFLFFGWLLGYFDWLSMIVLIGCPHCFDHLSSCYVDRL